MKSDIDYTVCDPHVVINRALSHVGIRCEIVDPNSEGPRRSEKYILLGMTTADAMRLLYLLESTQKQFSLRKETAKPITFDVFPPKGEDC